MRRWWKKIGAFAGSLVGLGAMLSPANAQFGGGPPPPRPPMNMFAGEPQPPVPPDFPNPAPPGEPTSPFSLSNDGTPNAFNADGPPALNGYRFDFRAEYLRWWINRYNIPVPLVTSTTTPNLANSFGALGQSGTQILFGGNSVDYNFITGGRATLGICTGILPTIEVSGIDFNKNITLFNGFSAGTPVLARPVGLANQVNVVNAPAQSTYLSAFPGVGSGGINIGGRFNLWSTDVDMFVELADTGTLQLDFLFGYKYAQLGESINIGSTFTSNVGQFFNGQVVNGFTTSVVDDFAVRNQFNGGTVGLRSKINYSRLTLWTDAKLSLGNSHEVYNLTGTSSLLGGGGSATLNGGILVGNSNFGMQTRNEFAIIPELNLTLSCQLTSFLRIYAGYNLLYWSKVGRPNNAINTSIDPRQVPTDQTFVPGFTGIAPVRGFSSTDFFGQGISLGLEIGF